MTTVFGIRAPVRAELIAASPLLMLALLAPDAALAYVGPGAGLTAIGTVLALFAAIGLALVGFVWYPVKRLLKRPSPQPPAPEAGRRAGVSVAALIAGLIAFVALLRLLRAAEVGGRRSAPPGRRSRPCPRADLDDDEKERRTRAASGRCS